MAELADAQDSKSCEVTFMWVRPPPPAPMTYLFELIEQNWYKNQSENESGWFFCCLKTILKSSKRKDGVNSEDNKARTTIWGMSKIKAWIYMWIC